MNNKKNERSFSTISGLETQEYYSPKDRELNYNEQLNDPGEYPYTRGLHRSMYRGKIWTMRQYAGFGSVSQANKRYHYLLSKGTTGLSIAFDLPTQMGRDPDHALSKGEVGRVGVSISTLDDMRALFKGIDLRKVSVSMTINSTAAILLGFYLVIAEEQGVGWEELRGTIQNDILKEYIARGTYIYPPNQALRIVSDIFAFCAGSVPNWNTVSISGYHIREAGSTAVQEVAFTLADGISYVENALRSGLNVDDFAPRLAFFFNCHNDFLEEIAKFRAARRLWARIMRERLAKKEQSLMMRFHTQTAGSSLTAQQPLNNVVRTTVQALAAVLGGTQSLHTNSYDEALGLPTEASATLALRTQQIIASESGVINSADPLGGSWLIENWTDRLEAQSRELIEQIDRMGGMVKAIELGFPQECIQQAAYQYQCEIEDGKREIVGVNRYVSDESKQKGGVFKVSNSASEQQCRKLTRWREKRGSNKAALAIGALTAAAKSQENLMPVILTAIKSKATLGEISDALRSVFGEFREGS